MMSWLRKRSALAGPFLILLTIALGGCSSAGKVQPAVILQVDKCRAFDQLPWHVDDTVITSTQVRRHNRTHACLCKRQLEYCEEVERRLAKK